MACRNGRNGALDLRMMPGSHLVPGSGQNRREIRPECRRVCRLAKNRGHLASEEEIHARRVAYGER